MTRRLGSLLWALIMVTSVGFACSGAPEASDSPPPTAAAAAGGVCGATRPGPDEAPPGAVRVDPAVVGDLATKSESSPAGTTFWLAAGRHRLGGGEFTQVEPQPGDTYVGAPGAVLDGSGVNRYAFTGTASKVSIRNLTIKDFVPPANEGVVNHDSGADWLIEANTLIGNDGAAMMAGARQVMRGNCVKDNGQYGLNACCGAITDVVLQNNEFVGNNADDVESKYPGCGCSGAMKFWGVDGADIRGNWIHDNRGPGIWADTNNNDFLIEHNRIEGNDGSAIFYETSYNAVIRNNEIRRNNLVEGKGFADGGDSFPAAAIYISESGGDPRIKARTDKIDIHDNVFEDNWSAITLWENADRFCNSPANTSTDICTLIVKDPSRCSQPGIAAGSLYDDCRWKTQRVTIHENRFSINPSRIGCDTLCARMAVLSNFGTQPEWSPYKGDVIRQAITFDQENSWHDNTYVGPWTFMPFSTDGHADPGQWQSPPYRQDAGSTFTPRGDS